VLTLFSLLVQPATMARYVLPSLAALAPVTAFLCQLLPRPGRLAVCLALAVLGGVGLLGLADHYRERDRKTDELIAAIRALPEGSLLAFEFANELFVVDHYAPDVRARIRFLDFEVEDLKGASKHRIITRDVVRQVFRYRGRPALIGWPDFQKLPRMLILIVPGEELHEPLYDIAHRFPSYRLEPRQAGMYELVPAQKRVFAVLE
jgi:hypothetical protein